MQQYELEAWLGNDHDLTGDQIADLLRTAGDIEEQYPGEDNQDDRMAALTAAYRLMTEEPRALVVELAAARDAAKAAERQALVALRQIAVTRINNGDATESGFARQAGVDRQAVRKWLGKKD